MADFDLKDIDLGTMMPASDAAKRRLGAGIYTATEFMGVVTLKATGIQMSGLNVSASFVLVPTFAPPTTFQLIVEETHPEFANLIIGQAETRFTAGKVVTKIAVYDSVTGGPGGGKKPKKVTVKLLKQAVV